MVNPESKIVLNAKSIISSLKEFNKRSEDEEIQNLILACQKALARSQVYQGYFSSWIQIVSQQLRWA